MSALVAAASKPTLWSMLQSIYGHHYLSTSRLSDRTVSSLFDQNHKWAIANRFWGLTKVRCPTFCVQVENGKIIIRNHGQIVDTGQWDMSQPLKASLQELLSEQILSPRTKIYVFEILPSKHFSAADFKLRKQNGPLDSARNIEAERPMSRFISLHCAICGEETENRQMREK